MSSKSLDIFFLKKYNIKYSKQTSYLYTYIFQISLLNS